MNNIESLQPASRFNMLRVAEDADRGVHWFYMHNQGTTGRACFRPGLVSEILSHQQVLGDRLRRSSATDGIAHIVLASDSDAFNLGGDLELFCRAIRAGDRATLLSYALAGFGIVATLSTLGVSWDKLQWLVAALSVGLGFGLQEIFANFISGLIILFERPVRIGDVVTIGNLSGTVSRIRIRATTITDFDRKDIIVPNKTFITGQLINWSLSDTVTRVTIKVGVAYGSDLDKVKALLYKAAQDNPRVLKEPEPQVFFLNFGESTLDHELRIHVRDLGDRNPATDEINRFIDREFNKAGISIAFRQVDIFLKNFAGQQLQLSAATKPADGDKPATDDRA
mgnify:CR=1 FL=1